MTRLASVISIVLFVAAVLFIVFSATIGEVVTGLAIGIGSGLLLWRLRAGRNP